LAGDQQERKPDEALAGFSESVISAGATSSFRRQALLGAGLVVLATVSLAAIWWSGISRELAIILSSITTTAACGLGWGLLSGQNTGLASIVSAAMNAETEAVFISRRGTNDLTRFVYTNPAFNVMFPASSGEKTGSFSGIKDMLDEGETPNEEFSRLLAVAENGVGAHAEIPFRTQAGNLEWRQVSVVPFDQDEKGYSVWRMSDITPRREMESARRREEERFVDFLDHMPAGFFSADGEGRILYTNKVLGDWLGISPAEIRARNMYFSDFVVAGNKNAGGASSSDLNGDVTLRGPSGVLFRACLVQTEQVDDESYPLYSRSILLRELTWRGDDGIPGTPVAANRVRWLFDEAPVGIILLDLHGDVTDVNRAFLKLQGVHRDAVLGRPFTERISKVDRGDISAQLSKVVMGIMPATHLEVRMPAMGERELIASLYASRLEDNSGEVAGLVLHFIDTTEQKNLEVQFAQSQKIQAVGQLAGGVAHDFNNLLTAMIGFSDLLLTRHGPDDPSFSDIMQIKQNANRATNLVRQLLAFSRQQTLEPVILDVTESLSDLSNLLGRLIGENLELAMTHARDLWLLRVDRGQFDQVIINLAVNARDAMPGGGTLSIETSNVTLEAAVQRGHEVMVAGDYVLIEVSDTGTGISNEDIQRIFEPFFSTKEVGAGTGLGLSTVYGIVHQTGGYIFVDSAPGEGATFSIYLPRYDESMSEDSLNVHNAGERSEGLASIEMPVGEVAGVQDAPGKVAEDGGDLTGEGTVLLVEDEDAVRMFGARALRNKGYSVLEASDGENALDVINATDDRIDLIISDVVMPGMDGHTLVKLVRHELPHIRVILMSGYSEDVFAEDIERDADIHFLPKPFSLKELAGLVKDVIGT